MLLVMHLALPFFKHEPPAGPPLALSLQALVGAGLTFIDTAEVYGFGKSEEFLGEAEEHAWER